MPSSGNHPGYLDVPSTNSAANESIRDVIGGKLDSHVGNSIYAILKLLDEHAHSAQQCYPSLADSVRLTTAAGAWTYGVWTELVPANAITSDFDLHWINVSAISANDEFQLQIGFGAGGAEVGAICSSFERTAVQSQEGSHPLQSPVIPANTRVAARMASKAGGAKTADVKLHYHVY